MDTPIIHRSLDYFLSASHGLALPRLCGLCVCLRLRSRLCALASATVCGLASGVGRVVACGGRVKKGKSMCAKKSPETDRTDRGRHMSTTTVQISREVTKNNRPILPGPTLFSFPPGCVSGHPSQSSLRPRTAHGHAPRTPVHRASRTDRGRELARVGAAISARAQPRRHRCASLAAHAPCAPRARCAACAHCSLRLEHGQGHLRSTGCGVSST